jgi:uncharacterized phage protein (TIGR01671 family)
MRESKYRAWYKPLNIMCDVAVVNFYAGNVVLLARNSEQIKLFTEMNKKALIQCEDRLSVSMDKVELMQYTEFEANGKKVFEGDIIPYHFDDKSVGIVKYGEYKNVCDDQHAAHIGFYVDWQDEKRRNITRKDLGFWFKVSEVKGNIYENPGLLEDSNE